MTNREGGPQRFRLPGEAGPGAGCWAWVSMLFYVWVSLTFVALVSQFWAITSHALDSRQARRLFGFIGAGGLLGSVAGGQLARLAALTIGAPAALLVAGLLLAAVALLLGRITEAQPLPEERDPLDSRSQATREPREARAESTGGKKVLDAPESSGLRLLWASPHLGMIGLVLLLSVLVAQTVDLQFSWAVEQATAGLGERTAWFGNFFSAMGVAAFLFQIFFTSRIHTVLGVGVALRVLPVVVILGTLGFQPLFLPRLISQLRDRRLKADARDALVAFGAGAIPILAHFIQDREESAYVRRALPRVVAQIQDDSVPGVLVTALQAADDSFLRAQIVEALASRRDELAGEAEKIEEAIRDEAGSYLARLADAVALAPADSLRFQGPVVHRDRQELSLLLQMIVECLEDHLKTLFGMLALIRPVEDVWAAWRSLVSGRRGERAHALEYLDNTLSGDLRRHVFAVIDDSLLEEKLRRGSRLFSVPVVSGVESVRRLVEGGLEGDADARALATAGLYTLYTERMMDLYPLVGRMGHESRDPAICETAAWVGRQLARDATGT